MCREGLRWPLRAGRSCSRGYAPLGQTFFRQRVDRLVHLRQFVVGGGGLLSRTGERRGREQKDAGTNNGIGSGAGSEATSFGSSESNLEA